MIKFKSGKMSRSQVLFLAIIFVTCLEAQAQFHYDTSYYTSYPQRVTGRAYFSNKYTTVRLRNSKQNYNLRYQPNTSINIGIGATYKWATLNLGIGILNRNPARGRTKYLDLQFHNYGRKFTLDLLGQFYRGFYLFPKGEGTTNGTFYARPDLHVNEMGGSFQFVVNHKKFSYRASFLQNEWQKKSAGSFLVGFEAYYGKISADSTIVPTVSSHDGASEKIREIRFFEVGPNVGYAYTFVIQRHYFLTGSAAVSLDYGTNVIDNTFGTTKTSGFSPNTVVRACGGYNSAKWAISILYLNNGVQGTTNAAIHQLALNTGNIRVIYVRRFLPNRDERKVLKVIK